MRHQIELGYDAPDVFVAGTPCQAYSVAGRREGLSDERGALTLEYVKILDTIDEQRKQQGKPAAIGLWENVPGVLSSKDNAFGCFLGDLAGEDCELVPPGKRWSNAGCVFGPKRTVAWRVLDAQYFGVAQRRRRVFVVASAREGVDPVELLFEFEGVRRDTAPSRETEKAVATLTANGVGTCGADDNQAQAGHLIPAAGFRKVAFGEYADDGTASTMKARDYKDATDLAVMAVHGTQDPDTNVERAHTLGRNYGQENALIALSSKDYGGDATVDMSPTLRACGHTNSHANAGAPPAVATTTAVRRLMPVECERLQGFPDGHTDVPYRGKPAADGHRYKAIGNSKAIPCVTWLGKRIKKQIEYSEFDQL